MDTDVERAAWQSTSHLIIPHPTEARILLLPETGRWALPSIRLEGRVWRREVAHISPAVRRNWGIDVTVLRCAAVPIDDKDSRRLHAIYVLENHSPTWAPPDTASWVDRETLTGFILTDPDHRAVLETYLNEADDAEAVESRPPWARPGWFDEASSWILQQLARLGYAVTSPIEQVRTWGISSVLRARTTSGDVYFKVALAWPLAAHEPLVTQTLAAMYPDYVRPPLAIDVERRWMLLPDLGPMLIGETDLPIYEHALRGFGGMQRESAAHIDGLLSAGCVDRRLNVLEDQIDPLLEHAHAFSHLCAPEIQQLRELAPTLKTMCRELAGYKVPQSLVHGDFHPGNMALHRGRAPYFFDWTDACVSHPFLDLVTMFEEDDLMPVVHAARRRLTDVYLSVWLEHEPMERLRGALQLARPLGALHQAITYQDFVPAVEVVTLDGLQFAQRFWLRKLLQFVADAAG